MKAVRKSAAVVGDINVTPMVDVMLVLLIIFMVITPMILGGVPVELARAENPRDLPDAMKEGAAVVAVTRDGRIFLGSTQRRLDELASEVRERVAAAEDKTVYVKADSRAKYRNVADVVDEVRSAGIDRVGLLTDRAEGRPRP